MKDRTYNSFESERGIRSFSPEMPQAETSPKVDWEVVRVAVTLIVLALGAVFGH